MVMDRCLYEEDKDNVSIAAWYLLPFWGTAVEVYVLVQGVRRSINPWASVLKRAYFYT